MTDMLKKKRQGLETLLHEMEKLKDAVRDGRFEELDELAMRREAVVETIKGLDREHECAGEPGRHSQNEVEDLKALLARIAEITDGVTAALKNQAAEIQDELSMLHRRADASAGYRKQAAVKI